GVTRWKPEQHAAVDVRRPGEPPTVERPAFDRPTGDITGADCQPAAAPGRGHDGGEVLGPVGAVGVHLDEQLRAVLEPKLERILVGTTEPQLGWAVQHAHPRVTIG